MRLLTAKGVEDEGRRRGRGGLGKKSSFANERIFRTEALELDEPLPSSSPQSSSSSSFVLVVGLLALAVLLVKSGLR